MSFRDRMKKRKKGLKKKHNDPPKKTGARFPTIFLKDKIPTGVEFYRCIEGENLVDILPWEAGSNMPLDESNNPVTKKGELDYVLDIWVHQNLGKTGQPYVCPYENFGEPCPVCEFIKMQRLPKEDWSKIRAKRRSIYLVWSHNSRDEEKKGVQIFDAAHFFMEEKIEIAASLPRGGGHIVFSDPDEGMTLFWKRKGTGQTNTQYLGHNFIDREGPIPDKYLDQTFPLDSVVNMHPPYEQIAKDFNHTKTTLSVYEPGDEDESEDDSNDAPTFPDEGKELKPKKRKRPSDRKKKKKRKKD